MFLLNQILKNQQMGNKMHFRVRARFRSVWKNGHMLLQTTILWMWLPNNHTLNVVSRCEIEFTEIRRQQFEPKPSVFFCRGDKGDWWKKKTTVFAKGVTKTMHTWPWRAYIPSFYQTKEVWVNTSDPESERENSQYLREIPPLQNGYHSSLHYIWRKMPDT